MIILNILETFYAHGGYTSDSAFSGSDNYIEPSVATSTYIPQAVLRMNSLCETSVSVNYTSMTSGNLIDDLIVSELALSIADSSFDKVHVDPETREPENKHWTNAYRYMIDMYGTAVEAASGKLEIQLPKFSSAATAYEYMTIATLSE